MALALASLALILSRRVRPVEIYFLSKAYTDMAPYLESLQALKITDVNCAPFTLVRIFKSIGQDVGYDFSQLKSITVIGAPSSQSSLNGVYKFLTANGADVQVRVERALGITEAAAMVATWNLSDPPCFIEGCQGRLEPNITAAVMVTPENDDGNAIVREAANDEPGDLWLKGPSFIRSYYKNEAATREAFTSDGWFKTGDVGFFREGKLFIVDRKKVQRPTHASFFTFWLWMRCLHFQC